MSYVMVISGDDRVVGPFEDESTAHALAASLALDRRYDVMPLDDPESFEICERDALGVATPLERMSPARLLAELVDAYETGDLDRVAACCAVGGGDLRPEQRQRWADMMAAEQAARGGSTGRAS